MADTKPSFMSRLRMPSRVGRAPAPAVVPSLPPALVAATARPVQQCAETVTSTTSSTTSQQQQSTLMAPTAVAVAARPRAVSNGAVQHSARSVSPAHKEMQQHPGMLKSTGMSATSASASTPGRLSTPQSTKSMFHSSSVIRKPAPNTTLRHPAAGATPSGIKPAGNTLALAAQSRNVQTPSNCKTSGPAVTPAPASLRPKPASHTPGRPPPQSVATSTAPATIGTGSASTSKLQNSSSRSAAASATSSPSAKLPMSPSGVSRPIGKGVAAVPVAKKSNTLDSKKPTRSASLKGPSREASSDSEPIKHNSPSSMQTLKNRAKSLKLPGRKAASPVSSKLTSSNTSHVNAAPGRPHSSASNESTGSTGSTGVPSAQQTPTQNTAAKKAAAAPSAKSKTPRAGFGFGPRPQVVATTPGSLSVKERSSDTGGPAKGKIQLLSYDHSPSRKIAAVTSPQVDPLHQDTESPCEQLPFIPGSCPPAISSALEETALEDELAESTPRGYQVSPTSETAEVPVTPEPVVVDEKQGQRPELSLNGNTLTQIIPQTPEQAPLSASTKKKLSFSPSTEFPTGLTDASPTLPDPGVHIEESQLNTSFNCIAPMSLLGPDALSNFHGSSLGSIPTPSQGTGGRSSARVAAQRTESVPYRLEGRRRSGSAGDCILLSTRSPSPPSSPTMEQQSTMRMKSPSQSSLPRADSSQDVSTAMALGSSPKQTSSSYFRHSVAMAHRTPTASLKESRLNALSGSTPSLSRLGVSKLKGPRTPAGPYVVLDIETYRQMQSEIKNLKSLLLQLKRELQQDEVGGMGIPHHGGVTADDTTNVAVNSL
ncbi:mucin-5AC-like [Sycon ciliatum]|uniref:mucin-5AC-like n=1 Tax=Sycon ciliatum TaxID=27933 RepID=UPI0031F68DEB